MNISGKNLLYGICEINNILRSDDVLHTLEAFKSMGVRIEEDIPSVDGMLYKDSIVKLDEFNNKTKKVRVTDRVGKVWWLKPNQISGSFL